MARMMRRNNYVIVSPTYGTDYSGDFRARDKRIAKALIEEAWEEIDEDVELRQCWNYFYSLYPAEIADQMLDRYEIAKPPSRERRMP